MVKICSPHPRAFPFAGLWCHVPLLNPPWESLFGEGGAQKKHVLAKPPWWFSGEESTCQCRRHGFYPWVEKIPWSREMATHSNTLAWEIPWTEPGGLWSTGGLKESDMT